jgi:hypothetical protein
MCLINIAAKELKDFASYTELESWFNLHNELQLPVPNVCDDYSEEAWHLAEIDGYHLDMCLVYQGQAYSTIIFPNPFDLTQPDKTVYHIANAARIRKPDGTSEYWYVDLNWKKLTKLFDFIPGGKY